MGRTKNDADPTVGELVAGMPDAGPGSAAPEARSADRERRLAEENSRLRQALAKGGLVRPEEIAPADPPPPKVVEWTPAQELQSQAVEPGNIKAGLRIPKVLGPADGPVLWEARIPADVTCPIIYFRSHSEHPADAAREWMGHAGVTAAGSPIACRRLASVEEVPVMTARPVGA